VRRLDLQSFFSESRKIGPSPQAASLVLVPAPNTPLSKWRGARARADAGLKSCVHHPTSFLEHSQCSPNFDIVIVTPQCVSTPDRWSSRVYIFVFPHRGGAGHPLPPPPAFALTHLCPGTDWMTRPCKCAPPTRGLPPRPQVPRGHAGGRGSQWTRLGSCVRDQACLLNGYGQSCSTVNPGHSLRAAAYKEIRSDDSHLNPSLPGLTKHSHGISYHHFPPGY